MSSHKSLNVMIIMVAIGLCLGMASGAGATQTNNGGGGMDYKYVTVDGLKIRYAHGGQMDAPTVVLLNPLPQSIMAYQPIWASLCKQFNTYAIDLPGFGRSEGGEEVMDPIVQGRLLHEIMSKLGIKSPHLVGPDVGTPVIFAYLMQHPEGAASVMVGDGPAAYPPRMGKALERIMKSGFWRWVYSLSASRFIAGGNEIGYLHYKPTAAEMADYLASYDDRMDTVMAWFAGYDTVLPKIDASLPDVKIPVKIFWGDKDALVLPENAKMIHQRLKRSEVQMFADTGHFSHQDASGEFAKMVIEWVNQGHGKL